MANDPKAALIRGAAFAVAFLAVNQKTVLLAKLTHGYGMMVRASFSRLVIVVSIHFSNYSSTLNRAI